MESVLITGITGYIGSQLAHALCSKYHIFGLVRLPLNTAYLSERMREKITLLPFDGTGESVLSALEESRPDVVYHLATHYTGRNALNDVQRLMESNLVFGANLLEAMNETDCRRLVYATTVTTHRDGSGYKPLTLYAATKQAFSALVEFYTGAGLMRAAALALSDTYGPCDRRPKVLNLVRQAVLEDKELNLTSGNQVYDAVYIDDVVRAFAGMPSLLENAPHQFFQLGCDSPLSLRDTVELMLRVNHLSLRASWGKLPEPERQIREKLQIYPAPPNWKQEVTLEDGLQRFWEDALTNSEE